MNTTLSQSGSIVLRSSRKIIVAKVDSIIRLTAEGPYTRIYLDGSDIFLMTKPLRYFEDQLPDDIFYRCHNSHIVNIRRFKEYNICNREALIDSFKVPVAKRRLKNFLTRIAGIY